MFDLSTIQCERTFEGHMNGISAIHYERDRLISGSLDSKIKARFNLYPSLPLSLL
jgi:hypothetical protein